ncbi:MAG: hypothetical protein V8S93_13035 [Lachnospiraceae bacterium]
MHDIEPAITVPKGFKNRGILELAGNLEDDSHIAIGRYGDGTCICLQLPDRNGTDS